MIDATNSALHMQMVSLIKSAFPGMSVSFLSHSLIFHGAYFILNHIEWNARFCTDRDHATEYDDPTYGIWLRWDSGESAETNAINFLQLGRQGNYFMHFIIIIITFGEEFTWNSRLYKIYTVFI